MPTEDTQINGNSVKVFNSDSVRSTGTPRNIGVHSADLGAIRSFFETIRARVNEATARITANQENYDKLQVRINELKSRLANTPGDSALTEELRIAQSELEKVQREIAKETLNYITESAKDIYAVADRIARIPKSVSDILKDAYSTKKQVEVTTDLSQAMAETVQDDSISNDMPASSIEIEPMDNNYTISELSIPVPEGSVIQTVSDMQPNADDKYSMNELFEKVNSGKMSLNLANYMYNRMHKISIDPNTRSDFMYEYLTRNLENNLAGINYWNNPSHPNYNQISEYINNLQNTNPNLYNILTNQELDTADIVIARAKGYISDDEYNNLLAVRNLLTDTDKALMNIFCVELNTRMTNDPELAERILDGDINELFNDEQLNRIMEEVTATAINAYSIPANSLVGNKNVEKLNEIVDNYINNPTTETTDALYAALVSPKIDANLKAELMQKFNGRMFTQTVSKEAVSLAGLPKKEEKEVQEEQEAKEAVNIAGMPTLVKKKANKELMVNDVINQLENKQITTDEVRKLIDNGELRVTNKNGSIGKLARAGVYSVEEVQTMIAERNYSEKYKNTLITSALTGELGKIHSAKEAFDFTVKLYNLDNVNYNSQFHKYLDKYCKDSEFNINGIYNSLKEGRKNKNVTITIDGKQVSQTTKQDKKEVTKEEVTEIKPEEKDVDMSNLVANVVTGIRDNLSKGPNATENVKAFDEKVADVVYEQGVTELNKQKKINPEMYVKGVKFDATEAAKIEGTILNRFVTLIGNEYANGNITAHEVGEQLAWFNIEFTDELISKYSTGKGRNSDDAVSEKAISRNELEEAQKEKIAFTGEDVVTINPNAISDLVDKTYNNIDNSSTAISQALTDIIENSDDKKAIKAVHKAADNAGGLLSDTIDNTLMHNAVEASDKKGDIRHELSARGIGYMKDEANHLYEHNKQREIMDDPVVELQPEPVKEEVVDIQNQEEVVTIEDEKETAEKSEIEQYEAEQQAANKEYIAESPLTRIEEIMKNGGSIDEVARYAKSMNISSAEAQEMFVAAQSKIEKDNLTAIDLESQITEGGIQR